MPIEPEEFREVLRELVEGGSEYARDCSVLLLQNELCEAIPS